MRTSRRRSKRPSGPRPQPRKATEFSPGRALANPYINRSIGESVNEDSGSTGEDSSSAEEGSDSEEESEEQPESEELPKPAEKAAFPPTKSRAPSRISRLILIFPGLLAVYAIMRPDV